MDMKKKGLRSLACLLALALVLGCMPAAAFADDADYQFGTAEYFSNITKDVVPAGFYYTDDWLLADPAQRNDALALISAQLAAAGGDPEQSTAFLEALGFAGVTPKRFDSEENDCAYTIGTKTLSGKTLAAVVFQGDRYGDKGWQQNVTINGDAETPEQASYGAAAKAFLADFNELSLSGDVIIWFTGQSRGGAVANLAAACLLEQEGAPKVFCFTFESPAVTSDAATAHQERYDCIQNYLCDDDPVAMLPVWDMTRYGREIVYNTASADDVKDALLKLNPDAEEFAGKYNPAAFDDDVAGFVQGLLDQLEEVAPTRAAYSEAHAVSFDADGEEISFSYTYQEGLQALCHLIFGTEGDVVNKLMPLFDLLPDLTYSYLEESYAAEQGISDADALTAHAALLRWNAAGTFLAELDSSAQALVPQKGMYALLRFLSPLLIHVPAGDWELPAYDEEWIDVYFGYTSTDILWTLAGNSTTLVFSHHPDVILARLSLLAPAPAFEDLSLTAEAPAAGDAAAKMPSEVKADIESRGLSWLVCEAAEWLTEDDPLQDGKLYSLQVTLSPAGHTVPDDFSLTLNGQEPSELSVTYPGGPALITGTWTFQLGEEQQALVNFDANGHGDAPESFSVPLGMQLAKADQTPEEPDLVHDETGCWRFSGWFDENGTPWDELTADGDITLYAAWTQMIDEISLTYEIPRVGDSGDALLQLSVPDGALYRVVDRESSLMDGEWNSVEQVESQDPLHLSFYLTPVSDDILFLTDSAEGDGSYLGTITVNGEAIDPSFTYWDWYYEDDEDPGVWYLWFQSEYNFTPLAKKTTPSRPEPSDPEPAEPQPSEPAEDVKKFMDVPEDAYFADAVDWAVAEGITAGTDETHFAPDEDCTRAQVMTMLWASAGAPEGSSPAGFEDVPADAYFAKAVAWALEKGITSGVDAKHFAPGRTVSRAEVITFLYLLAGEKTEAACPFTDVPESAYYADAVRWAYAQGVTAGTSETHFSPDAPCTRAQVVTFLYLALGEE